MIQTDLFSAAGVPLEASPAPPKPKGPAPKARQPVEHRPIARTAEVFAFPPARNVKVVADLTDRFVSLRRRYGRDCLRLWKSKYEAPMAHRLKAAGVPPRAVKNEMRLLQEAMVVRLGEIGEINPNEGRRA